MIEDHAVTCRFGVPPRVRARPASGPFGSLAAISPGFDALPAPEQAAAVNLLLERGEKPAAIAAGLGRSRRQIEALRDLRCRPLPAAFLREEPAPRPVPGLFLRPLPATAKATVSDRLADAALLAVDRLRIAAGVDPDAEFEMTMDELCQACDVGLPAGRRRVGELESRKWLRRKIRSGLPQLVMIALAGRCRLAALAEAKGLQNKGRAK